MPSRKKVIAILFLVAVVWQGCGFKSPSEPNIVPFATATPEVGVHPPGLGKISTPGPDNQKGRLK